VVRTGVAATAMVVATACGFNPFSRQPERSVDAFCAQVKTMKDLDEGLESGDIARINRQLDGFRELRDASPTDIEPQVSILVGITEELSRTVGTAKDPDVAAREVFAKHQGDLVAITAAGKAVQTYTADNCHIALNGTASTGSSVPAAGTSTVAPSSSSSSSSTAKPKAG
jgi:hypothetical protein